MSVYKKNEDRLASIFDLSSYEARLYFASLAFHQANLTNIAKKAQIPRTAAYPPLQSLVQKGMIQPIKINKRIYYRGVEPAKLKHLLKRKEVDLDEIISDISGNIFSEKQGLAINYYAGAEGIALASDIFLEESETKLWKIFEHPLYTLETVGSHQIENYIQRRVRKGIRAKIIASVPEESKWIKERTTKNKEELREVIWVSPHTYSIEASVVICGNNIQLISAKENKFAVIIRNKELARTFHTIHDVIWDRFKT